MTPILYAHLLNFFSRNVISIEKVYFQVRPNNLSHVIGVFLRSLAVFFEIVFAIPGGMELHRMMKK